MAFRSKIGCAFLVAAGLFLAANARADQQTTTWLGGTGSWSDATKWSGGVVPNNTADPTYAVNIDGGNPVQSRVETPWVRTPTDDTIDSLSVDADDTLFVQHVNLDVASSVDLHGVLIPSEDAVIRLPADSHLSTGTIRFDSGSSYGTRVSAAGTLTIDPGMTIQNDAFAFYPGWLPTIGSPDARLINRAYVVAGPHGGFALDGSTIENSGVFEVVGSGMIGFKGDFTLDSLGTLINSGGSFGVLGTLENAGQTFRINSATGSWFLTGTIHGGTIETDDGMTLRIPFSATATLDNVTINGQIVLDDRLEIPAGQKISGHGEIVIAGAEAPEGDGTIRAKSGTTVIGNGMTIRGGIDRNQSQFGDGQAMVGNPGSIVINHGTIRVDPTSQLGNGQVLQIAGSTSNDGTLAVTAPSAIRALESVVFTGAGKLVIDGGGELDVFDDLDLTTDADFLDVYPQVDGQPYDKYLIVTCGTLTGVFDHVTPGIEVDYSTPGRIFISGTPVPEPESAIVSMVAGAVILEARRSRDARGKPRG